MLCASYFLKSRLRHNVCTAFGLGGIFFQSTTRNSSTTTYLLRTPPSSAPREVPTPLVFVSSGEWDKSSQAGMRAFASSFAERGYITLEIDIGPPAERENMKSQELMHYFEQELAAHVRLSTIPFAPVIFARSAGCLIAQTYISSYPASGMLLISPPTHNAALSSSLLPTPLREFDFEPRFPCGILSTEEAATVLAKENRLWKDPGVDKIIVKDADALDGREGLVKIEQWMDEIGV